MLPCIRKHTKSLTPALSILLLCLLFIPVAAFGDDMEKKAGSPAEMKTIESAMDSATDPTTDGVKDDPYLNLDGYLSYSIDEAAYTLRLQVEEVQNLYSSGTSGTLKLYLYACTYQYGGGALTGYQLGGVVLGTLPAGYIFEDVDQLVDYYPPPYGTYWIVMILTEEDAYGDDLIVDYYTFDDPEILGTYGGQSGDSGGGGCFIESIGRKPLGRILKQTGFIPTISQ